MDDLASVLKHVLSKLEHALDLPAYNYIINTSPFNHQELPHYHWHIEVIPRLTKVAGFKSGSGFYINPSPRTRPVISGKSSCTPTGAEPHARGIVVLSRRDRS